MLRNLRPALLAAAVVACSSHGAWAQSTPAEPSDPVARLLAERGLIPTPGQATQLARQVRDKAADMASDLVLSAMNFLGVPYRRGGNTAESGFDCSGFTRHIFEGSLGLLLPRRAEEQARAPGFLSVQRDELKPGDLVFFNTVRRTFSHVGIYIGDNKFIHSPRAGGEVRIEDMRVAYWTQRYNGARRAPQTQEGTPAQPVPTPATLEAAATAAHLQTDPPLAP